MAKTKKFQKTNQTQSFVSKISNLSGKGKFFLFIAVFVIIGGGIFAYKSFAATGGLHAAATDLDLTNGAYLITETGQNTKKNHKVAVIPAGALNARAAFKAGYNSTTISPLHNFIMQNTGRRMRLCAFAIAPQGGTAQMINAYGGWEFKTMQASQSYSYVCTSYQTIQSTTKGYSAPEIRSASAASQIRVSSLEIEVQ